MLPPSLTLLLSYAAGRTMLLTVLCLVPLALFPEDWLALSYVICYLGVGWTRVRGSPRTFSESQWARFEGSAAEDSRLEKAKLLLARVVDKGIDLLLWPAVRTTLVARYRLFERMPKNPLQGRLGPITVLERNALAFFVPLPLLAHTAAAALIVTTAVFIELADIRVRFHSAFFIVCLLGVTLLNASTTLRASGYGAVARRYRWAPPVVVSVICLMSATSLILTVAGAFFTSSGSSLADSVGRTIQRIAKPDLEAVLGLFDGTVEASEFWRESALVLVSAQLLYLLLGPVRKMLKLKRTQDETATVARYYCVLGDFESAKKWVKKVDKGNSERLNVSVLIYLQEGKYAESEKAWIRGLDAREPDKWASDELSPAAWQLSMKNLPSVSLLAFASMYPVDDRRVLECWSRFAKGRRTDRELTVGVSLLPIVLAHRVDAGIGPEELELHTSRGHYAYVAFLQYRLNHRDAVRRTLGQSHTLRDPILEVVVGFLAFYAAYAPESWRRAQSAGMALLQGQIATLPDDNLSSEEASCLEGLIDILDAIDFDRLSDLDRSDLVVVVLNFQGPLLAAAGSLRERVSAAVARVLAGAGSENPAGEFLT